MSSWTPAVLSGVLADVRPGFACGDDFEDGVFQFRMNNITTEGQLDLSKKRRVPRDTRNIDSFLVERGDVLFNATNSPDLVGKTAYFPGMEEPAVFSNHFLRLRPHADRLDGRFLSRWLNLQFERGRFKGMCRQWVNQATVSRDALLAMCLPLPPPSEQRRIAEILDKADALRAKRRAALAQLDALTQSIFLDMFGDPATNPKGWARASLRNCTEKIQIGPFGSLLHQEDYVTDGIPLVNPKHIQDGIIEVSGGESVTVRKYGQLGAYNLRVGDVVMGRRGEMGRCAIVQETSGALLCGTGSLFIRADNARTSSLFLRATLSSRSIKSRLEQLSLGQTLPNLNSRIVEQLEIPLPPFDLQRDFAGRVAAAKALKATQQASLSHLDALFASLQHRAFRGEL